MHLSMYGIPRVKHRSTAQPQAAAPTGPSNQASRPVGKTDRRKAVVAFSAKTILVARDAHRR